MNTSDTDKIKFHFRTGSFYFTNRTKVKVFLLNLFKKNKKRVETINYIFCTDDYLLAINKKHLNHDTYTDIITFELSEKGKPLLSDIYISIDTVRENSRRFKTSFIKELHRVIFHGALHLCSFKDKSVIDAANMRNQENQCLSKYFVSREIGFKD